MIEEGSGVERLGDKGGGNKVEKEEGCMGEGEDGLDRISEKDLYRGEGGEEREEERKKRKFIGELLGR